MGWVGGWVVGRQERACQGGKGVVADGELAELREVEEGVAELGHLVACRRGAMGEGQRHNFREQAVTSPIPAPALVCGLSGCCREGGSESAPEATSVLRSFSFPTLLRDEREARQLHGWRWSQETTRARA